VQGFQRARHPRVDELAAGREDLADHDLADAVVGEVEPLADTVQNAPPDQLFEGLGGLALGVSGGEGQQVERALAPDDGGDREELAGTTGQPLQPSGDELTYPLGKRQRAGLALPALLEHAQGLHHDEGMAFAGRPDAVAEMGERRFVGARPRQGPYQGPSVGA
jgi:hypothetical protein